MAETRDVPLSSPVKAGGEEITTLTLRKPIGQEIIAAGVPFVVDQDGGMQIHAGPMSRLLAKIAGVPPSTIGNLGADDWLAASMECIGFFGRKPAEKSDS